MAILPRRTSPILLFLCGYYAVLHRSVVVLVHGMHWHEDATAAAHSSHPFLAPPRRDEHLTGQCRTHVMQSPSTSSSSLSSSSSSSSRDAVDYSGLVSNIAPSNSSASSAMSIEADQQQHQQQQHYYYQHDLHRDRDTAKTTTSTTSTTSTSTSSTSAATVASISIEADGDSTDPHTSTTTSASTSSVNANNPMGKAALLQGYLMCFHDKHGSSHGRFLATTLDTIYGILKGHARHSIVNESCVHFSATGQEVADLYMHNHASNVIKSIYPVPSHMKYYRDHIVSAVNTLDADGDAFHLLVALIPGVTMKSVYTSSSTSGSTTTSSGSSSDSVSNHASSLEHDIASSSSSVRSALSLHALVGQLPCEVIPDHPFPGDKTSATTSTSRSASTTSTSTTASRSSSSRGRRAEHTDPPPPPSPPPPPPSNADSSIVPSDVMLLSVERRHWEDVVSALASHSAVAWVEARHQYTVTNYHAQFLCLSHHDSDTSSSSTSTSTTTSSGSNDNDDSSIDGATGYNVFQVFNLTGRGHVIGISDTGIDRSSCFFQDDSSSSSSGSSAGTDTRTTTITSGGTTSSGGGSTVSKSSKIIYYEAYVDDQDDAMGHGTHVTASAAGKSTVPGYLRYNGVAPDAQIAFVDIGHTSTGGLYVPGDLFAMFQRMYEAGARVMTNSWGAASYVSGANRYSFDARSVDLFMYNYPDSLVLFAAGNHGSNGAGSVVTPSTNKNGICVGASVNNDQSWISLTGRSLHSTDGRAVAYFSSQGPTEDMRLKPDIIAPGWWVTSARSMGAGDCELISYSGTSMSSPIAAGVAVLVRDYFTSGFYPTGRRTASDAFVPSGALIKAVMIHSGRQVRHLIKLGGSKSSLNSTYPSNIQGYGLLSVASVLSFEPQTYPYLSLFVRGAAFSSSQYYTSLSSTGDVASYEVRIPPWVPENTPFRVTLAYTDAVNTYSYNSNNRAMVNILSLKVVCKTTGEVHSPLNTEGTVAMIHISSAVPGGTYSISVIGSYVLKSQPFALVATCNVAPPKGINGSTRDGYDSNYETSAYTTTVPVYRTIFALIYALPVLLVLQWKYKQMIRDFEDEGTRLRELYERLTFQSRVDFREVDSTSHTNTAVPAAMS